MADLTVTAANVVKGADAKTQVGLYGATVTAGQTVYADPADGGKFKPADADADAAAVPRTSNASEARLIRPATASHCSPKNDLPAQIHHNPYDDPSAYVPQT
jgi:hypothetical protein